MFSNVVYYYSAISVLILIFGFWVSKINFRVFRIYNPKILSFEYTRIRNPSHRVRVWIKNLGLDINNVIPDTTRPDCHYDPCLFVLEDYKMHYIDRLCKLKVGSLKLFLTLGWKRSVCVLSHLMSKNNLKLEVSRSYFYFFDVV